MAYKNTDYSTSMRGDVTPIKSVMYRTENNIARPYFMRKVEQSGPDYSEPFYIEDISGSDNTLSIFKTNASAPTLTIEKSLDRKIWETMGETSTTAITATVPANGRLYFRCSAKRWALSTYNNKIAYSSNFNIGGNIMSLLYGSSFTGEERTFPSGSNYTFFSLFQGATTLLSAENLLLPATTLLFHCYDALFYGCTSLTTAPELPATTLAKGCYSNLFCACRRLIYIKVGFTAWPSTSSSASDYEATNAWTQINVNTNGTFVCPAGLPKRYNSHNYGRGWETSYIPCGWTVETY